MNITKSLRPHCVFCIAGFAPLPELDGYVEYKARNASASEWPALSYPNAGNGWRIHGSTFDVKYDAIPQFLSPLPPSRISSSVATTMLS